jgi:hypothetical protein
MFELMLSFRVAAQNMRDSLLLILEDIDTSIYLPSEMEASSSSIGSNGDAQVKSPMVHMNVRKW